MSYTYTKIDGQRVQTEVAASYNRLNAAFKAKFNLSLKVTSATRTYAEQKALFLARFRVQASGNGPYNDVRWYQGKRYVRVSAAGTVAVPGTSNHEEDGPIGPRAVDIHDTGTNAGVTIAGNTRSNWIKANASKYGFNPAGYNFGEPWHIEWNGTFGGGSVAGEGTGQWPAYAKYGAAWVKSIQTKLNKLGYKLTVDGKDGADTQKAVINFQGKHGLKADGVAGPDTNAMLDKVIAGNSPSGKLAVDGQWGAATTKAIQKVLGVTVDGNLGAATIKALQKALKVTQDGSIGPATIRALQKLLKVTTDGQVGPGTIKALQTYLNSGGTFTVSTPKPTPTPTPDPKPTPTPTPTPTPVVVLTVDGQWGPDTTKALQTNLKVKVSGTLDQTTIKALQTVLGQVVDGQMGSNTIKALQTNVGATVDGALGPDTIKKLQTFLNKAGVFHPVTITSTPTVTYPKPAAPTYPGASYWNHSPNSSPRRTGDKVQYFVIHHAADTSSVATQINRFMTANDRNVSPNWLIGKDGSVSEIVPPDKYRAWTTGAFDYNAVTVETQDTSGDPTWGISEESHVAIAKLVAWAAKRYGFPINREHVLGHREVPNIPATACPGPSMNLDKIVAYAIAFAAAPVDPTEPIPLPDTDWTIKIPKSEATELGKLLDEVRKLLP